MQKYKVMKKTYDTLSGKFNGCLFMSSRLRVCRFQCRPDKKGNGICGREAPHSHWSEATWKKWNHIFA